MRGKTFHTAAVVIPPEACWEPIQRIRRVHDRQVRRWMPHVTMLYPFVSWRKFEALAPRLAEACAGLSPFSTRLARFRWFEHREERFTLWLEPEPGAPWQRLWTALVGAVPQCDDTGRHPEGFTPHLSVGQVQGRDHLEALREELQATWAPLEFVVDKVSLIRRSDPPKDIFGVYREIRLGAGA